MKCAEISDSQISIEYRITRRRMLMSIAKKIFATQLKSADDANHNKFVLYYSFNTKLLEAYYKTVDPHTWKLECYW